MTWDLDNNLENADWTKQSWDLPPYKSYEFFKAVTDLEAFRKLPVYKHAVEAGLIHDDEWVDDCCAPAKATKGDVDDKSHSAATSPLNPIARPSRAQLRAGNYRMGHIEISGLDITIENPAGSYRRGDKPGWPALSAHYGYIRRTEGADGDHVDVFVSPGTSPEWEGPVFVIDQYIDGKFDEHKCFIGYRTEAMARAAYLASYEAGWKGLHSISELTFDAFKEWLTNGDTTKPFSGE